MKPTYRKSCSANLLMWSDLTLSPLFKVKLKSAYILLIIGPRGLECVTNLLEFMCWESFAVVRFDLGPLVQGQTAVAKLKSAHISLIIDPRDLECENNL